MSMAPHNLSTLVCFLTKGQIKSHDLGSPRTHFDCIPLGLIHFQGTLPFALSLTHYHFFTHYHFTHSLTILPLCTLSLYPLHHFAHCHFTLHSLTFAHVHFYILICTVALYTPIFTFALCTFALDVRFYT